MSEIQSQQTSKASSKITTVLNPHDVLLGRGVPVFTYSGNVRFRELAKERKHKYASSKKRDIKNALASEVISIVNERGGRFLREIIDPTELAELGAPPSSKAWAIVDTNTMLQKVKQAMREPENQRPDGADTCSPDENLSDGQNKLSLLTSVTPSDSASLPHQPNDSEYLSLTSNQQTDANLQPFVRNSEAERLLLLQAYANRAAERNRADQIVESLLQQRAVLDRQVNLRNLLPLRNQPIASNSSAEILNHNAGIDRSLTEIIRAQQGNEFGLYDSFLEQTNLRVNDGRFRSTEEVHFPESNGYLQLLRDRNQLTSSFGNRYDGLLNSLLIQQNHESFHRPSIHDSNLTHLILQSTQGVQSRLSNDITSASLGLTGNSRQSTADSQVLAQMLGSRKPSHLTSPSMSFPSIQSEEIKSKVNLGNLEIDARSKAEATSPVPKSNTSVNYQALGSKRSASDESDTTDESANPKKKKATI